MKCSGMITELGIRDKHRVMHACIRVAIATNQAHRGLLEVMGTAMGIELMRNGSKGK